MPQGIGAGDSARRGMAVLVPSMIFRMTASAWPDAFVSSAPAAGDASRGLGERVRERFLFWAPLVLFCVGGGGNS